MRDDRHVGGDAALERALTSSSLKRVCSSGASFASSRET